MIKRVLVNSLTNTLLIVLLTLSACSREEANSPSPGDNAAKAAKADAKTVNKTDEAPRAVDPLKEGY
jgi:hypothetical protein